MIMNYILSFGIVLLLSCTASDDLDIETEQEMEGKEIINKADQAKVTAVNISGEEGAYTFNVELSSPDTGCDQYADWWEVIDADGNLVYRRVLSHSHVSEQPFIRSGGVVDIKSGMMIYVRGHMNTNGYGTIVYSGTVADGLIESTLADDFAIGLAVVDPQPPACAF